MTPSQLTILNYATPSAAEIASAILREHNISHTRSRTSIIVENLPLSLYKKVRGSLPSRFIPIRTTNTKYEV